MSGELILIVDDNDKNLKLARDILTYHGFRTLVASTGRQGIDLSRESDPDVVLLDIQLPDVSGIDLCARFRELQPNLPVVVCTGCTDPDEAAELLKLGIHGYFAKPVPMDELLATMEAMVP